ncbi:winged helix-turn-helix transcriptional regulator [Geoglobus acetivorans]|uniref:Transcriptional regulator, AsnC family n=1 Tax=Geoglobus acetivorans TaxID=565033 RepID=A0A0A7GER4_GEOAI|nr:Transcriptional regulator, AsnC family [Geoglobus acetivorans]MBE8538566.1 winged helix-turn-helix transcriptional regulator [Geoglobus acetivorans]
MRKNGLDEIDKKIVEYILKGKTQSDIAKMLGITLRTVQNRMKALEDEGYLIKLKEGYWIADYQKLGLSLLDVTFLDLAMDSKDKIDVLIEHLKKLDFVENVFEIMGSAYDLGFIVRYKDIEEYREQKRIFLKWLRKNGININHIQTFIASKTHKDHRRTIIV